MVHWSVPSNPGAVQVCSADDRNVAWRKALAQTLGAQGTLLNNDSTTSNLNKSQQISTILLENDLILQSEAPISTILNSLKESQHSSLKDSILTTFSTEICAARLSSKEVQLFPSRGHRWRRLARNVQLSDRQHIDATMFRGDLRHLEMRNPLRNPLRNPMGILYLRLSLNPLETYASCGNPMPFFPWFSTQVSVECSSQLRMWIGWQDWMSRHKMCWICWSSSSVVSLVCTTSTLGIEPWSSSWERSTFGKSPKHVGLKTDQSNI